MDVVIGVLVVYSLAITIFATVITYLTMRHALRLDDLEEEIFRIKHPPKTEHDPIKTLEFCISKAHTRLEQCEARQAKIEVDQTKVFDHAKNVLEVSNKCLDEAKSTLEQLGGLQDKVEAIEMMSGNAIKGVQRLEQQLAALNNK